MSVYSFTTIIIKKCLHSTKLFISVVLFLCYYFNVNAQETTYWPVKNEAINLKTIPPSFTYSSSKVVFSNTVQCDSMGNLLFYSSGDTIWNKNHVVMDGGGQILSSFPINSSHIVTGVTYSIQNTLDKKQYYILYLPSQQNNQRDLTLYRISIDMSQNGGLGKVIIEIH